MPPTNRYNVSTTSVRLDQILPVSGADKSDVLNSVGPIIKAAIFKLRARIGRMSGLYPESRHVQCTSRCSPWAKSRHRVYTEARHRLLGGQVADLTANLSRRGSIRVDVSIDRVAPYGGEQRVESFLAPGESLRGELQDLRGRDASGDGSRRTRARRRARRHGCRGGTVRRLAQPHVDRTSGVLLTEVEVRLIDELRTDNRCSDSVGELVGQLIGDFAFLFVDLERKLAVPGTEEGAGSESWPNHLLESGEVGLEASVVLR